LTICAAEPEHREPLLRLIGSVGEFSADDIECASAVVADAYESGRYTRHVALSGSKIAGFACYAPTALTETVFDLYWIAVDPRIRRAGIGTSLLQFVEDEIRRRGGQILLIETASKPSFGGTHLFYQRLGYSQTCRVKDFYRVASDKLVFCKTLK
jgi:GNAT superfamily N-acetyltransferase